MKSAGAWRTPVTHAGKYKNIITDFIEKPEEFVSDLAIIGIYYFKDGAYLKDQLQYLIDNFLF